jgi:hypothetical protein
VKPIQLVSLPLLGLLLLGAALSHPLHGQDRPEKGRPASKEAPPRYALLVGCTKYPSLPKERQLHSAPNDVQLLKRLLTERFHFPPENIRVLAEDQGGEDRRPTRANIEREFKRLARDAGKGAQVFIWLSGHGSQQFGKDPDPTAQPKPDDLRQTFLPADIGSWEDEIQTVRNAILDYELRDWTRAITARGAFVWAVVDACHSGTVFRDADDARSKGVSPKDLGIPEKVRAKMARATAPAPLGNTSAKQASLAAIYACQPEEQAWELNLPMNGKEKVRHGMLTYCLVQELSQAGRRLTYRQLTENIHRRYDKECYHDETPMVEFDQDRYVLEQEEYQPSPFRLVRKGEGWAINGGSVHGLTVGTVLRVRPPASEANPEPFTGHVRITAIASLESQVEPSKDGRFPAPEKLLAGGECRPVYVDYGSLGLRVAVATAAAAGPDWDLARLQTAARDIGSASRERTELEAQVRKLADEPGALFRQVDRPGEADWLVCALGKDVYLLRGRGLQTAVGPAGVDWVVAGADGKTYLLPAGPQRVRRYGPAPAGGLVPWLKERLERIARAEMLLKLASESVPRPAPTKESEDEQTLSVSVDLVDRATRRPIRWHGDGIDLPEKSEVQFRVKNLTSSSRVFVTVLLIDEDCNIQALFPQKGNSSPRLGWGEVLPVSHRVGGAGRESVVVIAIKAIKGQPPVDFTWLAQSGLRAPPADSPLAPLLRKALAGSRDAGGLPDSAIRDYVMVQRSYKIVPPSETNPKR